MNGKKLYTCRALLAYNSPVMAKILSSGTSRNKDLDLPEKEFEDVVELLAYIDPRVDYIITGLGNTHARTHAHTHVYSLHSRTLPVDA